MAKVTAPAVSDRTNVLGAYDPGQFYCEMLGSPQQDQFKLPDLWHRLLKFDAEELRARANAAAGELLDLGITFTVYSERDAIDRVLPFDIVSRVLAADEWRHIDQGAIQRVAALKLFLRDIYHDGRMLRDDLYGAHSVEVAVDVVPMD